MRILFCNYEYPPLGGGGGVINALLAEEMAKHHDVTVLTSQGLGLPRYSVENDVEIVRAPTVMRREEAVASFGSMLSFIPSGIWAGRQLLGRKQFDIINTHFVLPTGPVGHILSRIGSIPNVLSLHGGDLYDPSKALSPHRHWPFRLSIRYLLRNADMVAGQSNNTLENMRRFYTPEITGERIPLAIQRPSVKCPPRAKYGFSDGDVLLVTVGRIIARKQNDQLIKMLARLQQGTSRMATTASERTNDVAAARLLIIGAGPDEDALRQCAEEHGVADRVHFMGFVEEQEKLELLSMSDIYVSTSQHEGFGLVYLEGMACGLPIVCYNHGGQTDFLIDGKTGYLVELDDLTAFEERCRYLIADRDKRAGIRSHNLDYVQEFFIDSCARRHETLFNQTIQAYKNGERAWHLQQEHSAIGSD